MYSKTFSLREYVYTTFYARRSIGRAHARISAVIKLSTSRSCRDVVEEEERLEEGSGWRGNWGQLAVARLRGGGWLPAGARQVAVVGAIRCHRAGV